MGKETAKQRKRPAATGRTATARRVFLCLIGGFLVIYLLRFAYELWRYTEYRSADTGMSNASLGFFEEISSYGAQNYASASQTIVGATGTVEVSYDQKYEMVARITSRSRSFEEDEGLLRKKVEDFGGVVQMERSSGLEGNRSLWLSVGVAPSLFDDLVESVRDIGAVSSFTVNKTDKTEEFRTLLARREALEKTLESYVALRDRSGEVYDLIALEEKIIETEQSLLQSSVSLGIFDENQSMCTVDFTLSEQEPVLLQNASRLTLSRVIGAAADAVPWSLLFYVLVLLFGIGTAFSALGIAFVWSKFAGSPAAKQQDPPQPDQLRDPPVEGDGGKE